MERIDDMVEIPPPPSSLTGLHNGIGSGRGGGGGERQVVIQVGSRYEYNSPAQNHGQPPKSKEKRKQSLIGMYINCVSFLCIKYTMSRKVLKTIVKVNFQTSRQVKN